MPDSKIIGATGLGIGLAFVGRPIAPEWAMSMAMQNYPMNIRPFLFPEKGMEVGAAREAIVHQALEKKVKYLWFLDDDVAPPFHAVRSLIHTLENSTPNVMVAAGIYCEKLDPTEPVVFRHPGDGPFWRWKRGDVFECTGIGTGCMVIKTEIFRHLAEPFFHTVDNPGTPERPIDQQTDDLYFCDKVIAEGYKILADSNVLCVHWGWDRENGTFRHYLLPLDSYPMRPVTEEEPRCERELVEVVA